MFVGLVSVGVGTQGKAAVWLWRSWRQEGHGGGSCSIPGVSDEDLGGGSGEGEQLLQGAVRTCISLGTGGQNWPQCHGRMAGQKTESGNVPRWVCAPVAT